MLVLSRKQGERLQVGDDITITVVEVRGHKTRIGIDAPRHIPIIRTEVTQRPDYIPGRTQKEPAAATPLAVTSNANPTNGQ